MNFKARVITHELFSGVTFGIFLAVQGIFILKKRKSLANHRGYRANYRRIARSYGTQIQNPLET